MSDATDEFQARETLAAVVYDAGGRLSVSEAALVAVRDGWRLTARPDPESGMVVLMLVDALAEAAARAAAAAEVEFTQAPESPQ